MSLNHVSSGRLAAVDSNRKWSALKVVMFANKMMSLMRGSNDSNLTEHNYFGILKKVFTYWNHVSSGRLAEVDSNRKWSALKVDMFANEMMSLMRGSNDSNLTEHNYFSILKKSVHLLDLVAYERWLHREVQLYEILTI